MPVSVHVMVFSKLCFQFVHRYCSLFFYNRGEFGNSDDGFIAIGPKENNMTTVSEAHYRDKLIFTLIDHNLLK